MIAEAVDAGFQAREDFLQSKQRRLRFRRMLRYSDTLLERIEQLMLRGTPVMNPALAEAVSSLWQVADPGTEEHPPWTETERALADLFDLPDLIMSALAPLQRDPNDSLHHL